MKLFHISKEIIKNPSINAGRSNADFGPGFYLSMEEDFAMRWVSCREGEKAYVNRYELDLSDLLVERFVRDEQWYDYIYQNRNGGGDRLPSFDVIIGPIANDTLYDVMGIPTSGVLGKEDSLALLQLGGEFFQVVIKSQRALEQLKWLDAIGLDAKSTAQHQPIIEEETREYQRLFQEYLEHMS